MSTEDDSHGGQLNVLYLQVSINKKSTHSVEILADDIADIIF